MSSNVLLEDQFNKRNKRKSLFKEFNENLRSSNPGIRHAHSPYVLQAARPWQACPIGTFRQVKYWPCLEKPAEQ